MLIDSIKVLEVAKAKVVALEQQIESQRSKALAELPSKYGFADADSFLAAVHAAAGSGKSRAGRKPAASSAKPAKTRTRKRAKITDEIRAGVKKMVADEKTGAEIAKAFGISLPTVQNIKKALGLVRSGRKRK
jgi:hypothetical protein